MVIHSIYSTEGYRRDGELELVSLEGEQMTEQKLKLGLGYRFTPAAFYIND